MIDEGIEVNPDIINGVFLKVFSQRIGRGIIIENLDDLEDKYEPSQYENNDPDSIKWQKYDIKDIMFYHESIFEYKEEMERVLHQLPLWIYEYKKVSGKLKEMTNGTIENRETMKMKITDNLEMSVTHIFDNTFFMDFEKIVNIERPEITLESVQSELQKTYKKAELQDICQSNSIEYSPKDLVKDLALAIAKKLFPEKEEEYKKEIELEKEKQRQFLNSMGYKTGDMVPVILEKKSTTKSKTEMNVKQMLDPSIYSLFYKENYGKLPVFMTLYLIVTPSGKTKHQIFTNYISNKQIENMKSNCVADCKRMFLHDEYKKNFIGDNFICNEKSCSYYDGCQKDMTLIVRTK
jgi:hypothetical protein